MKNWAFLVVCFYFLVLIILSAPLTFFSFDFPSKTTSENFLIIYRSLWYWAYISIMILGQALLLLIPIDITQHRLTPKRKLLIPIIASAFMFMLIILGILSSIAFAIWGDNTFTFLEEKTENFWLFVVLFGIIGLWSIWGWIFYRFSKKDSQDILVKRLIKWLLKGSVLELLVAVPSHIIVRHRNDCCAPVGTFLGIATGLSIMLLSFGPGVFFLFTERIKHNQLTKQ